MIFKFQFAESSPQAAELSNHGWSPTSPTDSKSDKNSTGIVVQRLAISVKTSN